jgi:hypothetical protein
LLRDFYSEIQSAAKSNPEIRASVEILEFIPIAKILRAAPEPFGNGRIGLETDNGVVPSMSGVGSVPNTPTIGGQTCGVDGTARYVGITDDVARCGSEHLRTKVIEIEQIAGPDDLSRANARAVGQTLINYYSLGNEGRTLLNRINSISPTRNPTA